MYTHKHNILINNEKIHTLPHLERERERKRDREGLGWGWGCGWKSYSVNNGIYFYKRLLPKSVECFRCNIVLFSYMDLKLTPMVLGTYCTSLKKKNQRRKREKKHFLIFLVVSKQILALSDILQSHKV